MPIRSALRAFAVMAVVFTLVAARTAVWNWTISPTPPSSGGAITVEVDEVVGPLPVKVELYVGGKLVGQGSLTQVPGSIDINIPSGMSGEDFEVRVSTATSSDSSYGTLN